MDKSTEKHALRYLVESILLYAAEIEYGGNKENANQDCTKSSKVRNEN